MKKLGQASQSKRQPPSDKAWWVSLITALSFCLWGTNLLPLQHLEYQLTANIAISQHRLPILQRLSSKELGSALINSPFSSIELLAENQSLSSSASSELRSVRVKVRCAMHCEIGAIERSLRELTKPSMETVESQDFAKQLRKEQWLLESCTHSMKRLELDRERELNAAKFESVELESVANGATASSSFASPFRLASYGLTEAVDQSPSELIDSLKQLNQIRTQNLDSMNMMLERLKAQANGFLSITGSPSMAPLVRPLTISRLLVLFVLCFSVWALLMFWLHPIRLSRSRIQKPKNLQKQRPSIGSITSKDDLLAIGALKTIHWLHRRGIPYLGAIQVESEADAMGNFGTLEQSAFDESVASSVQPIADEEYRVEVVRNNHPIQWLRSLGEGSLVLWIGLFLARLMFDPLWRELVAVAQLAALSRMISGI